MPNALLASLVIAVRLAGSPELIADADKAFTAGDWPTAATAYQAAVQADETNGQAWFRLGYALHASGEYEKALEAHRRAAAFPNIRPIALYNLACAQSLTGAHDDAITTLRAALDAGFTAKQPLANDTDFAAIRDRDEFKTLDARANVYAQFDFWIGSWDVFNPAGKQVGTNVITASQMGKVITENWTNAFGTTGTSMNFYDPADGKWHQIWVDPSGNVTRYVGEWSDGAMRFDGVSTNPAGASQHSRMSFTPQDDGTVRQFIEQSKDGGTTWSTMFDGTYRPQASATTE